MYNKQKANKMKMKSLKATLVLCTIAGLVSCGVNMPKETQSSFETMTVKKSDIELPYKFSARMKGQNDVTITPQVSGQLMKICVTEGQQVRKGQVLFIIDSRNAQLELEAAKANLQAAQAQENSAKLEYEANKNLFEKKIVSSYMLNNSENAYKQAQAAVAQAKAAVNRAKVNLGFCTITAPVSGITGEVPVRTGDQVSPMSELTMLSGNTTMYAEFSVTEAIIEALVQSGMKADEVDKYIASLPGRSNVCDEKRYGVSPQGSCCQSDGCGQCIYRFTDCQGFLPQPRRPSVLRHTGYSRYVLRREGYDCSSPVCRGTSARQGSGL